MKRSLSQQQVVGPSSVTRRALPQPQSYSSTSDMNSIYSAVIKVFQGEGLQMNELYLLNESIRWLLKTEMGSFLAEYFQNQLLSKGLGSLLEEVQLNEGEEQLFFLEDVWIRFYTEILPTLQAIFYPLQGHELTVRQMALLAFRDLVLMRLPLEELLPTNLSVFPTSIRQMLLILQGVHEPRGHSMEYLRLEKMLEMVVSPYLWNCKQKRYKEEEISERTHLIKPEIRITQHISEVSLLTPLLEQEGEGNGERRSSLRRHSASDGTDMQLLTVITKVHSGLEKGCMTISEMRKKVKRNRSRVNPEFESQSC